MTFSFGFSGDDIDIDIDESEIEQGDQGNNVISAQNQDGSLPEPVKAKRHEMEEWVGYIVLSSILSPSSSFAVWVN